jgi:uncharacterized protein HemX
MKSLPVIAAVIAVLALVIAIGVWFESRSAVEATTQSLGAKLGEHAGTLKDVVSKSEQAARDVRDLQNRVAQMEGKLAEFQSQRQAMEDMTRDLARAPEDWLLAEIEQTLNIASRELTLAGNVRAAIVALQSADQRLARADKLQQSALRRAITQDLERLKATPLVDTAGISLKLDNLTTLAATLPLSVPDRLGADTSEARTVDPNASWATRLLADFVGELKQVVKIRNLETNESALLSPQQGYFLRENLKLRLLSARTGLIARDELNYKQDLKLVRDLLSKYFDPKAKVNVSALATVKQLAENPVSISPPDINASLNAVRTARAARERVTR